MVKVDGKGDGWGWSRTGLFGELCGGLYPTVDVVWYVVLDVFLNDELYNIINLIERSKHYIKYKYMVTLEISLREAIDIFITSERSLKDMLYYNKKVMNRLNHPVQLID